MLFPEEKVKGVAALLFLLIYCITTEEYPRCTVATRSQTVPSHPRECSGLGVSELRAQPTAGTAKDDPKRHLAP